MKKVIVETRNTAVAQCHLALTINGATSAAVHGVSELMPTSLSISEATKVDVEAVKGDDETFDDVIQKLLDAYARDNGQVVDPEQFVAEVESKIAPRIELAAYRGTKDAIEETVIED